MTATEILVILFGLLIGYWVVSQFVLRDKAPKEPPRKQPGPDPEVQRQRENADRQAREAEREREREQQRQRQAEAEPQRQSQAPSIWHEVLQVSPTADIEAIRRAYKGLMSQYHPDKVASLGPELRELCERKTKEINAAYDRAMAERKAARC